MMNRFGRRTTHQLGESTPIVSSRIVLISLKGMWSWLRPLTPQADVLSLLPLPPRLIRNSQYLPTIRLPTIRYLDVMVIMTTPNACQSSLSLTQFRPLLIYVNAVPVLVT